MEKYAKDNNILSYLSYKDKMKEYIDIKDFEEKMKYNGNIEIIEDYIFYEIQQYNFNLAMKNNDIMYLLKLIYECEFDIVINEKGNLDLIDLQGAYLSGVESYENFYTIEDIIERLKGSFLYDYFGIE